MKNKYKIAIVAPVPFYYHVPLYRDLNKSEKIDLTVMYCSDETLKGEDVKKMYISKGSMTDRDFLLAGYKHKFLKNYSLRPSFLAWPFGLINFGIWKEIKNGGYDAMVLQAWTNITWILAFLACVIYGTKVFFMTDSNIAAEQNKGFIKKSIKRLLLEKILFRNSSGFLTSGTANENFYKYYGVSEEEIRRFPFSWGYDDLMLKSPELTIKRDEIRKSLKTSKDDFAILYVGRLSKEKSIGILLDAYKKIDCRNKKLFLVGDGPLRDEIKNQIEKQKIEGVVFWGFQPREEVFKFYAASDVLVLPSSQETWGIVINEAMCFSLPVIASDQVGAVVDLIKEGENGFIFPAENSKKLLDCLEQVVNLSPKETQSFRKSSFSIMKEWISKSDPSSQIISLLHISHDGKPKFNLIKKISYNPILVKLTKFLGLRNFLRKLYFLVNHPRDGILKIQIGNLTAKIHIKSPDELRLAESITGNSGEKSVIEELIKLTSPRDIFYDVGANIGIYSIFQAKKVLAGKVFAFEPEENSFSHLQDNIKINNLSNAVLIKKALGERNEISKLYIGRTTGNFSLLNPYEKSADFQEIEVIHGDNFVEREDLPIPNIIKIDVEGYEYSVLKGLENTLSDPGCRVICCEIHPELLPKGIKEEDVLHFIKLLGFKNVKTFKRAFSAYHVIAKKN